MSPESSNKTNISESFACYVCDRSSRFRWRFPAPTFEGHFALLESSASLSDRTQHLGYRKNHDNIYKERIRCCQLTLEEGIVLIDFYEEAIRVENQLAGTKHSPIDERAAWTRILRDKIWFARSWDSDVTLTFRRPGCADWSEIIPIRPWDRYKSARVALRLSALNLLGFHPNDRFLGKKRDISGRSHWGRKSYRSDHRFPVFLFYFHTSAVARQRECNRFDLNSNGVVLTAKFSSFRDSVPSFLRASGGNPAWNRCLSSEILKC